MTSVYLTVMYLGGNDVCGVNFNLYPQLAQWEYTLRITPQTSFLLHCMRRTIDLMLNDVILWSRD